MVKTIDEILRDRGYRVIATLDKSELFERVLGEIEGISKMDYFIIPVCFALDIENKKVMESSAYGGFHFIYVKEK